jgi:manganese/iron transport system ATP-binding protein/manganese/zinc/iron transport system ATP- binding protein
VSVRVHELTGGYGGGRTGVSGVHFEAGAGERVAVLGPNGGGKTTLFRALLGALPEVTGTVELPGRPAYVPQTERSRLDFPLSALDVALMGAYGRTRPFRRIAARDRELAAAALEQVDLADRAGTPFGALSGGQRQRVLIARALVQDAAVLLLDEPLSGVDAVTAAQIGRIFGELAAQGRTLLISTHDVQQARSADRVLCLNRTQVAYGPPATTLSVEVLQRTYGGELVMFDEGTAVVVDHHGH